MEPLLGMYGSVEAECEVQRTKGVADGLPMSSLKSDLASKGPCLTTRELLMDYGEENQAKSGRCRFVDENLGRITWSGRKGILVEVEHKKRKRKICRILRSSSPKAVRRLMSWQKKEHCWMKG